MYCFKLVHSEDRLVQILHLPHSHELEKLLREEQRLFVPMQYGFADPDRLWDD